MKKIVTRNAYAKINLGLDVVARRADGYHEIRTVMQTLGLCDTLVMEKGEGEDCITLECVGATLSAGSDNLVYKAAHAVLSRHKPGASVHITLTKRIPMAAGLGGGSADAAATINGLDELFQLKLADDEKEKIATALGADIPFLLKGGSALCEGIGEKMTSLSHSLDYSVVLVRPDIPIASKWAYESLDIGNKEIIAHPNIDGIVKAIGDNDGALMISYLANVFEEVVISKHQTIGDIKESLMQLGADIAQMSGSGPTVFALFSTKEKAKNAYAKMKEEYEAYLTSFVNAP